MMVVMRHTPQDAVEVRRLLALREAEGLTFQQLSDRSGVAVHALASRAHQDYIASRREPGNRSKFVEVMAEADPHEAQGESNGAGIELELPGGLRVRLFAQFDEESLVRLLSIVSC